MPYLRTAKVIITADERVCPIKTPQNDDSVLHSVLPSRDGTAHNTSVYFCPTEFLFMQSGCFWCAVLPPWPVRFCFRRSTSGLQARDLRHAPSPKSSAVTESRRLACLWSASSLVLYYCCQTQQNCIHQCRELCCRFWEFVWPPSRFLEILFKSKPFLLWNGRTSGLPVIKTGLGGIRLGQSG